MLVRRVIADPAWFDAIIGALDAFETDAAQMIAAYEDLTDGLPTTERIDYFMEAGI